MDIIYTLLINTYTMYKYKISKKMKWEIQSLIDSFLISDDEIYETNAYDTYDQILDKITEIDMLIDRAKFLIDKEYWIIKDWEEELNEAVEIANTIMDKAKDSEEIDV